MFILRVFLIFVAVFYLLRMVGRKIFGGPRADDRRSDPGGSRRGDQIPAEYKDITDQKIEDADYEEL